MRYIDLSILQSFSSIRMKRDFVSFIGSHFDSGVEDTPESRVYWSARYLEEYKNDINLESFIFTLESELIPVLARMEEQGVLVDEKKLREIGERIRSDMSKTEKEIYEVVGEFFNINSPKQIQVILFEKLGIKPTKKNKTGFSVDTEVLEEIAKEYDIARLILEYRLLAKLDSTYISGLLKSIDPKTKRIHTTYDSFGAATGRMSSNDPNLQNIPAGLGYAKEIKECFIASVTPFARGDGDSQGSSVSIPPGERGLGGLVSENLEQTPLNPPLQGGSSNILLVADYSQVELRVLAFLSQDKSLIETFENNEDIHMRTALFLFPGREITSHERRIAKTVNFGVIYGITGFGLSKTLDCSPFEANQYIEAFYVKYPDVRKYYDDLLENARKSGYVETYFGRRRYIPSINDANKTIRSIAEREAMNMPIQGTAADMIKLAMIRLDAKIREMGLRGSLILQVHDELVFDIPENEKEIFEKLVREVMEGVLVHGKEYIKVYSADCIVHGTETVFVSPPEKGGGSPVSVANRGVGFRNLPGEGSLLRKFPPIIVDISTGKNWAEAK